MDNKEVYVSQKFCIRPNNELISLFNTLFGARRWAFNAGIDAWNKLLIGFKNKKNNYPTAWSIRNELKKNIPEWFEGKISPMILDMACDDIEYAHKAMAELKRRHKNSKKSKKNKNSYQLQYKTKHDKNQSCRFYRKNETNFLIDENNNLYLPKVYHYDKIISKRGNTSYKRSRIPIHLNQKLRYPAKNICQVSIKFDGIHYYLNIIYRVNMSNIPNNTSIPRRKVGIDLGVKTFATLAYRSENQRQYEEIKGRNKDIIVLKNDIKDIQRKLSKKVKGSNHYNRLKLVLDKKYLKISNIRNDFVNKLSLDIVKRFGIIVIENLKVSNLVRNHSLAESISRQGFRLFRTKLEYKSSIYNRKLIIANSSYPSTQLCSCCGYRRRKKEKLKLYQRTYICPICGYKQNRDKNAAYNLKLYA